MERDGYIATALGVDMVGAMRRRRDRFSGPTTPRAIDPRTGFEVALSDLVKDGQTGDLIWRKVADRKQPQDLVTGVPDNSALPYSRPEPPDRFMSVALMWEDDVRAIFLEGATGAVMSEGEVASW